MARDEVDTGGLGRRVRSARERLGWTREALAYRSELSWSAIAQVEAGRRTNVRPSTLAALSRALGVSADYLIDGGLPRSTMLQHSAFAYGADEQFQTVMGGFLSEGIERSEATLAVTTGANIELLREHLGKDAQGVEFVEADEWYSSPVAALRAYKSFCDGRVEHGSAWVRVIGEPVWTGRTEAEIRLWTQYESLLNLVFDGSPLTVVCPYDERSVAPEIVRHAHLTHPHTLDDRGISESPDYTDPDRFALEPDVGA